MYRLAIDPFPGGREWLIPLVTAVMKGEGRKLLVLFPAAADPGLEKLVWLVHGDESSLDATLVAPNESGSGSAKAAHRSDVGVEFTDVNKWFDVDDRLGLRMAEEDSGTTTGTPMEPSGTW